MLTTAKTDDPAIILEIISRIKLPSQKRHIILTAARETGWSLCARIVSSTGQLAKVCTSVEQATEVLGSMIPPRIVILTPALAFGYAGGHGWRQALASETELHSTFAMPDTWRMNFKHRFFDGVMNFADYGVMHEVTSC